MLLRLLRLSRVLRILRVLGGKNAKDLRDLIQTLIASGPAIANVASVLMLVMFIYAVLGMQMFTFVMQNDGINNHANFETFGGAILLLFQVLTGDSWSGVMYGAMVDEDLGCDPTLVPSNCGSWLAMPYFVSYILIGSFVFLNLVVAVVLESFSATAAENEEIHARECDGRPELITHEHLQDFQRCWSRFDSNADQTIDRDRFPYVIARLLRPLGLAQRTDRDTTDADHAAIASLDDDARERERWILETDADKLEEAKAMVARLKGLHGANAPKSTESVLHFQDALNALVHHAYVDVHKVDVRETYAMLHEHLPPESEVRVSVASINPEALPELDDDHLASEMDAWFKR